MLKGREIQYRFIVKNKLSIKLNNSLLLSIASKLILLFLGPHFAPMEVLNCLAQERGYKIAFFPQQHAIPNHPGAMDDK